MRKFIPLVAFLICFSSLTSCSFLYKMISDPIFRYAGEHMDLEAATIHSIPGLESRSDHKITIIETDQYGRRLYVSYKSYSYLGIADKHRAILSILVVQKTEGDKVYFYGEQNYLFELLPKETAFSLDLVKECFSDEDITALKTRNMWNEPFPDSDSNLCSVVIEVEKSEKMSKTSRNMLEEKIGETNLRTEFLRKDANGRLMYFCLCIVRDHPNPNEYVWYIVMLNEDGTLVNGDDGIRMLDQSKNISQQILEFRTENGWVNS